MAKVTPITEQFQHFLAEMKDSFWGDLCGQTQLAWKKYFEAESERLRDLYSGWASYQRSPVAGRDYRNGYYERDFVTRFAPCDCASRAPEGRTSCPPGLEKFQRRAPELTLLIREAFLRGISTRQVGRVVATLTGEVVSAQTVSQLTRDLDQAVRAFHEAPLDDDWAYLFLDGVSLRVRRPSGRQRVQMLVVYGVRPDGARQLLAFLQTRGESQADWEALLQDLYRRGLQGNHLQLIVTDGCPGLATAIQTIYPRIAHQRCWVHKMRNILGKVRKADYDAVKADAQAIYLADGRSAAQAAARVFCRRWRTAYPRMVRQLEPDLPELLAFFRLPRHLWRKLRTTNIIERCFVEVRRRTRPMVCFVNVQSVERIIFSIFQRFNLEWKTRTLRVFTQAA